MNRNVAVVGASDKANRYSHKALMLLKAKGYSVFPVHPVLDTIEGIPVVRRCDDIKSPVHTVTLYVNPELVREVSGNILRLKPERVIFNPGTETEQSEKVFTEAGIRCVRACTIVLLNTDQFDTI